MHPPNPLKLSPLVAAPLRAGPATTLLPVPAHGLARPSVTVTGERDGDRAPQASTDSHPPHQAQRMLGRCDR